jgi:pre-mRNA-splicing factor CWC22
LDDQYVINEEKYATLKKEILDTDDDESGEEADEEDGEEEDEEQDEEEKEKILDKTETNLVALRRTIYLTIQSSLDFEECAHKLLKMNLKEGKRNTNANPNSFLYQLRVLIH